MIWVPWISKLYLGHWYGFGGKLGIEPFGSFLVGRGCGFWSFMVESYRLTVAGLRGDDEGAEVTCDWFLGGWFVQGKVVLWEG